MMRTRDKGFTLLEMAIVMTIIGLIVGAIFTAVTMIRSAHIQTMIGEYDFYVKSVNEFKDKFLALPGDMNNAESMWGSDTTCPNSPVTITPKVPTCNGDGNGTIGSSDFNGSLSNTQEWFRAWQQMANAGMLSLGYPGTVNPGALIEGRPGINIPSSSLPGSGWTLLYYSLTTTSTRLWGDKYGHILTLGGYVANNMARAPVLSSSEAFAIDQKIDDGMPGTGIVRAWRTLQLPTCTTNDTTQTAQSYVTTTNGTYTCSLIFLLGM